MVAAILVLLIMPFVHVSKIRSCSFRPIYKKFFWLHVANFLLLVWLGSAPAEEPYVIVAQISSTLYFGYYIVITPLIGYLENHLFEN